MVSQAAFARSPHDEASFQTQGRVFGVASANDLLFRGPAHRRVYSRLDVEGDRYFVAYFGLSSSRGSYSWQGSVNRGHVLPLINRFPNKPLIYNVTWKTLIYLAMSAVIHYLERLVESWRHAGGLIAANQKLLSEMVWPHFWAIQLILLVLIAMYCTIHELVRVIGRDKLLRIFFGPLPVAQVEGPPRKATGVLRIRPR